ncbi:MAG: Ig-like domain-containing protein, partial [Campylobacterota bacterium]|nr:Ig-like domain-containing protein [Campylobacterota bacterium]
MKNIKILFLLLLFTVGLYGAVPTVTITDNITDAKTNQNITFTFTFSEGVNDFVDSDITLTNGTKGTFTGENNDTVFTLVVSPRADFEGDITVDVDANVTTSDSTTQNNTAATQATQTVDTKKPTVNSIILSDSALKIGDEANVTIVFSEAVLNFDNNDIELTDANGTLTAVTSSDGNITFTATFTPSVDTEDDTNIITVNISDITDSIGNALSGNVSSANYVIDTKKPTVTISLDDTNLKIDENATVTITFSEVVSNFDNADLTIENGTLSGVGSNDGNVTFTATFTPTQGITDTNNTITVNTSDITDTNTNPLSSSFSSPNYTIDTNISTPTIPNLISDSVGENGTTTDNITNDNTPDINGTNTYGETVDIELFDESNTSIGTVTSIADGNSWNITTSALDDGVHNITLEITDTAGNKKRTTTTLDITIDTQIGFILNIDDGYINSIEQNSDHNVSGSVTSVEVGQTVTIQNNLNNSEVN